MRKHLFLLLSRIFVLRNEIFHIEIGTEDTISSEKSTTAGEPGPLESYTFFEAISTNEPVGAQLSKFTW